MASDTIILDTDNALGVPFCDVDDGLALLFLLAYGAPRIAGITLTHGNAPLVAVEHATRRLLRPFASSAPPVFRGARGPAPGPTGAARFLVDTVAASPGQVRIVAIGPLSNLAAAADLDPRFFGRCAEVVCLGGTVGPARLGRWKLREVNFAADEAAARRVLATRDCPVTIIPTTSCLELTLGLADIPSLPPRIRAAVRRWMLCCRLWRGLRRVVLWDVLAALWCVRPDLLLTEAATVTLDGGGRLVSEPGGPHRLVRGLAGPEAARALVLDVLGGGASAPSRSGVSALPAPGA